MPPAADESHPPPGIPNEPEHAKGEESDEYDIEDDDDEYAGEDDEEEGEPNGQQTRVGLTALLLSETAAKGAGEEEEEEEEEEDEDDDDEEYAEEVEGEDSTALSSVKRGRDLEQEGGGHEDEAQDAKKKVKV